MALPNSNRKIYCETSTSNVRPYLPEHYRRIAFNAVHNLSHPGIRTTRKMLQEKYFWPSMNVDISNWARACQPCQQSKIHRHTNSNYGQFPSADRFQHIHVDIVGPLPPSPYGHRYLLTIIDRKTRWPEAIPLQNITAESVAKSIFEGWIARFGCPTTLTSDQGRQFESQLFTSLTRLLGIEKTRTTPYHPQSNGLDERWHRTLKAAITANLTSCNTNWLDALPTVLLGLRAAPRNDTGVSAAQMTYGTTMRLSGDFFTDAPITSQSVDYTYVDQLRNTINEFKSTAQLRNNNKTFVHKDLRTCENVYLRIDSGKKSLQAPYDGPYPVLHRDEKVYRIQLPGREVNVSIDRLKPAYSLNEDNREHNCSYNHNTKTTRYGRKITPVVRFA